MGWGSPEKHSAQKYLCQHEKSNPTRIHSQNTCPMFRPKPLKTNKIQKI